MKLQKLYSRRSDGKVQSWEIEVEGNKFRVHSGIKDGQIVTTEWTVTEVKNSGKKNATTAEEQALAEAKAILKKKIDKGYFENESDIDNEIHFEPMLAKVYQDYKEDIDFSKNITVNPKLDGMRCIVKSNGMFSRNGKPILSSPHIYEALKPLFQYNQDYIFDGELYADKLANDFDKLMSLAKKSKPTKEDILESSEVLEYHIYDFPYWDDTFVNRYNELEKVLSHCKSDKIKMVKAYEVKTHEEVDDYYGKFMEDGYEGLMVRLNEPYENKRTKSLLKYKEFRDEEFLILDVLEGLGNKSGMAGAIVCELKDGRTFNSNIKGNRKFFRMMLTNKSEFIGKQATIKYFNLTPSGVPRFPYFLRLREEE